MFNETNPKRSGRGSGAPRASRARARRQRPQRPGGAVPGQSRLGCRSNSASLQPCSQHIRRLKLKSCPTFRPPSTERCSAARGWGRPQREPWPAQTASRTKPTPVLSLSISGPATATKPGFLQLLGQRGHEWHQKYSSVK